MSVKVFMNGPSTICGRQPLKTFTWTILEHLDPCIWTVEGMHIEIAQPNKHYSDYDNRKGCFSLNIQDLCHYKYCFQDVMTKWPGSVYDLWFFLNSSINKMFRNETISSCVKVGSESTDPIPVFLFGDPVYPSVPFLMN